MNPPGPIVAIARAVVILTLTAIPSYAGSATWNSDSASSDWNAATNWTPATVPNGSLDTASFGTSNVTDISFSAPTTIRTMIFLPGVSVYTFTCPAGQSFSIESGSRGDGINNLSGLIQNFVAGVDSAGQAGSIVINLYATTSNNTLFIAAAPMIADGAPGLIFYSDFANAGTSTLINKGGVVSGGLSGAIGGETEFFSGNADHATIINEAGTVSGAGGGSTSFTADSTARAATITCRGATVNGALGGTVHLMDDAHAGRATLIAEGGVEGGLGGAILFAGRATGGSAKVKVYGNGSLDLVARDNNMAIGSLEGDGQVLLGIHRLQVGSNNESTVFSGTIQNGGSLVKNDTGTLTLSGASTYSGRTTVRQGVLLVTNTSGSATGTNVVQVDAGTLAGTGIITGPVKIGDGALLAPGIDGIGTLTIQGRLTFNAGSTYNCELDTDSGQSDVIVTRMSIIEGNFSLLSLGTQVLPLGTVFTVIDNRSAPATRGRFANLADSSTFTVNGNTFQANYEGGDGNDLTLTVVP